MDRSKPFFWILEKYLRPSHATMFERRFDMGAILPCFGRVSVMRLVARLGVMRHTARAGARPEERPGWRAPKKREKL
ncbi:hypothetical protein AB0H07_21670 [Streptomyces sp. NPDC021354]|uniref:hypothetical protein n=1 Tax=Streptomyces sp. NPDC021354 TaxID=3154793 RepID=UPI0033CC40C8